MYRAMIKKIFIFTAIISLICPWGCKKPEESAAGGGIRVALSIFPLYDMARTICGDKGTAFFVVPAGADPHSFEPSPSVARILEKATLFIGVAPGFDGWVERHLPPSAARTYLMENKKGEPEANPHIWLSVKKARQIAAVMAERMSAVDPANGAYYRKNHEAYDRQLSDLDRSIGSLFSNKTGKSFIQWHESWNYFAADYGLTITGTVQREGSEKASVRSMKEIVNRARRDRVGAIVVGLSSEEKSARVLAGEIGGTLVMMDGIGDPGSGDRSTYLKLMEYNAKRLAEALR